MKQQSVLPLKDAFDALSEQGKRAVQLALCRHALGVWESHLQCYGPIMYVDSVVGMEHCVDSSVPRDALTSVEAGVDRANLAYRYQEPIVALQDDDLELPGHIELAYYAIYNLYRSALAGATIDDWLIVNRPSRQRETRRSGTGCSPMPSSRLSSSQESGAPRGG